MVYTSPEMERKLWDRLTIIAVEDVGFGESNAPILIHTLWQMSQRFGRHEGDRYTFAIHAARYLATRQKDRSSDEMHNWLRHAVEKEGFAAGDSGLCLGHAHGSRHRHGARSAVLPGGWCADQSGVTPSGEEVSTTPAGDRAGSVSPI